MNFEIDEPVDFIPAGKPRNKAVPVFIHASNQVVCHADVDCPARAACEDINIELSHVRNMPKRDGRDKPGHDEPKGFSPK